jgi:hypothetical protein
VRRPRLAAIDERHADGALVHHRPLQHELVVTEHLAVVAGEDDQGVLGQARLVERGEEPA